MREWRKSSGLWRWLLLACLLCPALAAAQVVELAPGLDSQPLSPHIQYWHDTGAADTPADAWQRVDTHMFAPLPDGNATFGFQRGAFWFHVRVVNHNPAETRWLLVQEYPLSDVVDVHVRYADGHVVHLAGGDHRPFSARSVRYRHPNFRIELPLGQPVDLLVRVESQSSMQVPLQLYTQKAFTEVSRDAQLAIGLYYGILLALFFYNLVLWLSLRDASYFWYLCHISAFGLVLFTLNGLGFEYLWPGSSWLADHSVPISICLALVAMLQFSRTFLELPRRWPRGNRLLLALMAFFILFAIASLWLPLRVSTPVASRAVLAGVIGIVIATIVVLRGGYAPARLLLLAWSMFLLGTAAFTLLAFGVLPKNFATEYGVQIGSALEMLLLSIALGHRYAALRNENQRIVHDANARLERKVAQRTQEVRSALVRLEEAHARLRDSSRRDGLTGLYNRTWFQEAFGRMAGQAHDSGRPLSLMMIDLDHFKAINDAHGHLAGDECLRWAARHIGRTLRVHDALLARFGGEEFVVALPGQALAAAIETAESVRIALTREPCLCDGVEIRITASIGVCQIDTGSIDAIDDALVCADRALYDAKANGRDRVCATNAGRSR
ncbi:sensor domain-containing diguanylate cyclase [Luteimonas sp. BDR2-5]|uniref:sensor domain-containing diguanylate cyclase n=1 Tax=Proluteimonas luteida TaxID=2878685 RepID=UPI001E335763|nr:diguanylate cyclase [Luteimonas sp. BDR2-5]MCD9029607.1 sensor domain-containing diguanylate cyclase [Luteimonas sp. BDR2-5]